MSNPSQIWFDMDRLASERFRQPSQAVFFELIWICHAMCDFLETPAKTALTLALSQQERE